MMMPVTSIRRRKDGSIDTDFYVAIGNLERGRAARILWARIFRADSDERYGIPADRSVPQRGAAASRCTAETVWPGPARPN